MKKRNFKKPNYYTTSEAAVILGLDRDKLREYVKKNKIAKKVNGRYRIPSLFIVETQEMGHDIEQKCKKISSKKTSSKKTKEKVSLPKELASFVKFVDKYENLSDDVSKRKNYYKKLFKFYEYTFSNDFFDEDSYNKKQRDIFDTYYDKTEKIMKEMNQEEWFEEFSNRRNAQWQA